MQDFHCSCKHNILPSPPEIVQLSSWYIDWVYRPVHEFIDSEQVLGNDQQAGFGAGAVEASTMESLKPAMGSGVCKAPLHRRASLRVQFQHVRISDPCSMWTAAHR